MRKRLLPLAVLCGVAAAQSGPTARQLASLLMPNDLKADVSFLASDALQGRGTPSPGLDIAAEYIAAGFRRAGLEPAGDDGYFQTAPFLSVTPRTDGMEFVVDTGGIHARPSGMGLLTPGAVDLSGAASIKVPATDASAIGALTPEQVRGKVLLLEFPAGASQMMLYRQLPAIGARLQPALIVLLAQGGQPTSTSARLSESGPAPVTPVLLVWDEAVRAALTKPGQEGATVSAHIPAPASVPIKLRNVAGLLRGSDPALSETYVVVTAHYDHLGVAGAGQCRAQGDDTICNGANDDASGTASVIEIARALAALPARPKRSILFLALFGEELGDRGSHYYAAHPIFPLARTVGDLNLEQLGRTDVDGGSSVGVLNVTGYDFSTLTAAIAQAAESSGVRVVKDERNVQYFARSDNAALAEAGVPAHTLSVGYMFPDYHQPGDEWPKLDYDNLAKVDHAIAIAIYSVADSPDAPRWNPDIPETARYIKAQQDSQGKP